jgi:hypothetical protein
MPNEKGDGLDFASTMSRAFTPPEPGGANGKDLPDGFPFSAPGETYRMVDTAKDPQKIPGATEFDYVPHFKGFIVYRPWMTCDRCRQAIAQGEVVLPEDDGDLECPHTQVKQFLEVRQQVLEGKAMCDPPQQVVLKDGTIVMAMHWYTFKPNHKRMRAARKIAMAQGAPPDGMPESDL